MGSVDPRHDIREFLSTRRARITPEEAGLPAHGGNRRVKGLRREEVAMLAGVFNDFVERIAMRRPAQPSEIAGVIAFLSGDDVSFVTGAHIAVDGGLHASSGQPNMRIPSLMD